MHERRRDPRTSKPFSLHNLLRTRAETEGLLLAVVGTPDGFVMASSRDRSDRQGARVAAHASAELFGGGGRAYVTRSSRSGVRLVAMRFEVEGRAAFVAALIPADRSVSLEALASCVKRILVEPARLEAVAA